MAKYWMGSEPRNCQVCGKAFGKVMIDGKTAMGPWGLMCPTCHKEVGVGLGLGRGQKYEQQKDGRWKKTDG